MRLAYLATHPSQYQAPLLARIAAEPDIELKAFFASDLTTRKFFDPGFQRTFTWDTQLLSGYAYEFLPALGTVDRISTVLPLSHGLAARLRSGNFAALWVHGYSRPYHLVAMLVAKRLGMRILLRDDATLVSCARGKLKLTLKLPFFRALTKLVDAFLAVGTLNRNYYLRYGVTPERIFDVPWAVDNTLFQAAARNARPNRERMRASLGLEKTRPVILFAGKLIERKRPGDLLEAYAQLSHSCTNGASCYLMYIGDGELRARLETRARELGLGSVRFIGFRNQTELPAFYDLCDMFVMPTVNEPWGLVVNEVMNAGKAVVISDEVGCASDLVRNGYNGFVYRAGDIGDLRRVLETAVTDPVRTALMGKRSLEIIGRWSFEEDVRGVRGALQDCLRPLTA